MIRRMAFLSLSLLLIAGCTTSQPKARVYYQKGDDVKHCTQPNVEPGDHFIPGYAWVVVTKQAKYEECVGKLTEAGYEKVREELVDDKK